MMAISGMSGLSTDPSAITGDVNGLYADLTLCKDKGKERGESAPVELMARRVPTPMVTVFNGARGSSARIFKVANSEQQKINDAYQALGSIVLPKLPGFDDNTTIVAFDLSQMTIRCKQGGTIREEDLKRLVDEHEECREAFKVLEDLIAPLWGGSLGNQWVETGRKASSAALQAMNRTGHETLEKLSYGYGDSAKVALQMLHEKRGADVAERDEALKKMTMMEKIIHPLLKPIKDRLRSESAKLTAAISAKNAADEKSCRDKIKQLRALEEMLERDRLGQCIAAAFAPPYDSHQNPDDALTLTQQGARDAQEMSQKYIDAQIDAMRKEGVRKTWPKWMAGKEKPIPGNNALSADVGALVFSSQPVPLARQAIYFWHQHNVLPKRECLADELLRYVSVKDPIGGIPLLEQAIADVADVGIQNAFTAAKAEVAGIWNGTTAYPPVGSPQTVASAKEDINAKVTFLNTTYFTP